MSHLVLSRKYRPQRFEDLVGQEAVAQTLTHAITSGRIGHAYLFIGPRGTGKTTTARIFAKALNCEKGPTPSPCGTCDSCRGISSGNDLDVVEMDAASHNGVDDVRALRESVGYRPARSRFRIWIVDEVHMLSLAAFNAFLKTLEEPPPQAKFLFCTTEAHKLPETFTSRVQRLEFRRIDEGRMAARLEALAEKEGLQVEAGVCRRIASGALGGLRDAESLLEQLLSCAAGGRVTRDDLDAVSGRASEERVSAVLDAVLTGDAGAALDAAQACVEGGAKPDLVLDQWVDGLRDLLGRAARAKPGAPTDPAAARALEFGLPRLARSIDLLLEKRRHLREGADGRLVVEVAAVELARLPSARDLDALVEALRTAPLPSGVRGAEGATPSGGPAATSSRFAPSSPPSLQRTPPSGSSSGPSSGGARVAERPSADRPTARRPDVEGSAGESDPTSAMVDAAAGCATGAGRAALPDVSLEQVVAGWGEFLQIAGKSRRLSSGLSKAKPVAVVGDALVLAVPETESIARGILRDREAAEPFRSAAKIVFGAGLRPVIHDGGPLPDAPRETRAAERVAPSATSEAARRGEQVPPSDPAPRPSPTSPAQTASQSASQSAPQAARSPGAASAASRPALPTPSSSSSDDVRTLPSVRAVLDAFGARVLAVQKVEIPVAGPAGSGVGTEVDAAGASAAMRPEEGR